MTAGGRSRPGRWLSSRMTMQTITYRGRTVAAATVRGLFCVPGSHPGRSAIPSGRS